ncbi:type I-E CRISPR-associated protein Cas7/Cse4/CasC [Dokdonella fugitiva]|jgi:CRISPR system Cascade subunit CasC|uniref:type I-E CRISPR-associated protein Cas7/Cse4/CasC n=1 Tax=Dokdonella fugitiva TaxID=328517 RepID=UPI0015FC0DFD|nr:type I-E CRISPR-associated protein Cas7/Cse4/CasC [Dokdonella fugitiva]MBA8884110.1 CRISPR system Cascade subunit CasC [Dokdonella fugitiva]
MNDRFLQLHVLTAYGPSNLNRDDLGMPKTAIFGNVPRLRISSQSLKRAWRTSDVLQSALAGHLGTRTKKIGQLAMEEMLANGLDQKRAFDWSKMIAQSFGKLSASSGDVTADESPADKKGKKVKKAESNEVETLVFLSREEKDAVLELSRTVALSKAAPDEGQLKLLRKTNATADLALFGRMLTADKSRASETSDRPLYNVEAAAQVAHAITVHRAVPEDDFFSAVDDLNRDEDTGSGHLGELGFGAGVFYLYVCVDRELLSRNLGGNHALAGRTLRAFTEAVLSVAPTGKQKSFASNARASFCLAELGNEAPRQLTAAFLKPISEKSELDLAGRAVDRLRELVVRLDEVYGFEGRRLHLNATEADAGSLDRGVTTDTRPRIRQVIDFTASGLE